MMELPGANIAMFLPTTHVGLNMGYGQEHCSIGAAFWLRVSYDAPRHWQLLIAMTRCR